jgi:hypothetical protein
MNGDQERQTTKRVQAPADQEAGFYHDKTSVEGVAETSDPVPTTPKSNRDTPLEITWTADGQLIKKHATGWGFRIISLSLLLGAIIFFITGGDWMSAGSVVVVGLLFSVLGSRHPSLTYKINASGVTIADKSYGYGRFQAFSVTQDRMLTTIELVPLQRFMPVVVLYLDPNQRDQIIQIISQYLPVHQRRQDFVDRIVDSVRI